MLSDFMSYVWIWFLILFTKPSFFSVVNSNSLQDFHTAFIFHHPIPTIQEVVTEPVEVLSRSALMPVGQFT